MKNLSVILSLIALLSGCASPGTQRVTVSDQATKAEATLQIELAVSDMVDEQKRISRIYRTLAIKAASLCGDYIAPNIGAISMTKPKGDTGPVFEKLFGVRDQRTILFVLEGSPAESAGLKAGDVVKKINTISTLDTKAIEKIFEKIDPIKPITYEIERSGSPMTVIATPEKSCRYPILLDQQQIINAFADGTKIMIARGMINFAKDDNELALVIAHELAHNMMKHIEAKKQNMAIGFLADLAVVIASRGQVSNPNMAHAGANAYSQEFESEADYVGMYVMANAGLPITDAPKFWRRMAAALPSGIKTNHTASHPSTPYRMVALEETVKEIDAKRAKGEDLLPNMKDGKFKAPTK